jgi:arginyl-tRNA--protein-N-Asp/Glu arginylyltransferase
MNADKTGSVFSAPGEAEPASTQSFWPAIPPPVRVHLTVFPEHPCSYFPDRVARTRALRAGRVHPETYRAFMDAGFRRSGKMLYQPVCSACRACQPVRVLVNAFAPSKSQRRCARRNTDLTLEIAPPHPTEEKYDLYSRYVRRWHSGNLEGGYGAFVSFLYDSPVDSLEFAYRDAGGKLVGVGICDVSSTVLSSVYYYFDPDEARRGPGTLGALREIQFAREHGIAYYYLGYWIDGCGSMEYKTALRPFEILWPDQVWRGEPVEKPYSKVRF